MSKRKRKRDLRDEQHRHALLISDMAEAIIDLLRMDIDRDGSEDRMAKYHVDRHIWRMDRTIESCRPDGGTHEH